MRFYLLGISVRLDTVSRANKVQLYIQPSSVHFFKFSFKGAYNHSQISITIISFIPLSRA